MSDPETKRPRLISICGSVHSGKTTISRMLAASMPNAAYIDGDMISAYVAESYPRTATIDDMLPTIHTKLTKLMAANLKDGLDVIVDYPFSDDVRREILDSLKDIQFVPKWFLLKPAMEKVLQGSKHRPELNDWEIDRIKYHYGGTLMKTAMAKIIDSTDQTPEETLKEMMEEL